MLKEFYDIFVRAVAENHLLSKLGNMAQDITGNAMNIILMKNNKIVKILPTGRQAILPPFCQIIRNSSKGQELCLHCRALIAIACYRSACKHSCHSGISVIAAPVHHRLLESASDFILVSTCAFRSASEKSNGSQLKNFAQICHIPFEELKARYNLLPRLKDNDLKLAQEVTEISALAIAGILDHISTQTPKTPTVSTDTAPVAPSVDPARNELSTIVSSLKDSHTHNQGKNLILLIRQLIEKNPSLAISVKNIAQTAGITPNYFSALYHKFTGERFSAFLNRARLSVSKTLLKNPRMSVKNVALKSGFNDAAYFIRKFKQETKLTPQQWRKKL